MDEEEKMYRALQKLARHYGWSVRINTRKDAAIEGEPFLLVSPNKDVVFKGRLNRVINILRASLPVSHDEFRRFQFTG
ncbi:MAG: hypothetical protein AAFY84_16135 [Pseudomonadota bacterium]